MSEEKETNNNTDSISDTKASAPDSPAAANDVTLSPAYLKKLEAELQKALENSVRFAAQEMKKELQDAINDVAVQNQGLIEALKDFESKLIGSFQSLAEKLYGSLSDNFNTTVSSIQKQNKELVSAVDKLEDEVRDRFQGLLAQSLNSVANELTEIAQGFKAETQRAVNQEVQKELEDFQETMRAAQQQTVQSLANMYKGVEEKKKKMEEDAEQEAEAYRKKLIKDIDKKLNDTVTMFLLENLGESLDISQQKDYIFEVLEENKEEIKKDLHA